MTAARILDACAVLVLAALYVGLGYLGTVRLWAALAGWVSP